MQPNEPQSQNEQPVVPPATPLSAPHVNEPQQPAVQEVPQPPQQNMADPEAMQVDEAELTDRPLAVPQVEPVQWQAPEYTQHDKSPGWYIGFVLAVLLLMAAAIFLMKAWTFALLVPVMAAALMVYSHRPPRMLSYVVSEKGLYINDQLHPMGEFKNFGIMQETNLHSLVLIPVKRFRPSVTVSFPDEIGEKLVDTLGAYLPMEELRPDAFDKIVRKLRI